MTRKDKDKLFELFQSINAYYKWLLAYRIIILQEIGIKVDEERLRNILSKIRKNNQHENRELCDNCKVECFINAGV